MKLEKELREWNFDDQLPVLARTGTEDPIESRLYGMCASSTTGKLFIYGGLIDEENQIQSNKIDYSLINPLHRLKPNKYIKLNTKTQFF